MTEPRYIGQPGKLPREEAERVKLTELEAKRFLKMGGAGGRFAAKTTRDTALILMAESWRNHHFANGVDPGRTPSLEEYQAVIEAALSGADTAFANRAKGGA